MVLRPPCTRRLHVRVPFRPSTTLREPRLGESSLREGSRGNVRWEDLDHGSLIGRVLPFEREDRREIEVLLTGSERNEKDEGRQEKDVEAHHCRVAIGMESDRDVAVPDQKTIATVRGKSKERRLRVAEGEKDEADLRKPRGMPCQMNAYLVYATQEFNQFAGTCEESINRIQFQIDRLDARMKLVESMVDSALEGAGTDEETDELAEDVEGLHVE